VPAAFVAASGIAPSPDASGLNTSLCIDRSPRCSIYCHEQFHEDLGLIREALDRFAGALDVCEPFARIREAINEARKMGVTNRAA
jgi:hypothetical protein